MALNKAALKAGILALTNELYTNPAELTPAACREKYAEDMSNLIDAFVKTGTVNVNVTTTGTATAHTGTGTGSIS